MNVLIIIPAYNEGPAIGGVIRSLVERQHHVLVVDDGSTDETVHEAKAAGAVVVRHPVNLGQGAALQTGFEYARRCGADVMVTFDADGQHSPDDIPKFVHALEESQADVALGSRFLGEARNIGFARKFLLKALVAFTRITSGMELTDAHNGFRALRVATTTKLNLTQNRMAHASELVNLVGSLGLKYVEVPCVITYSDYSLAKGQKITNSLNILWELLIGKMQR